MGEMGRRSRRWLTWSQVVSCEECGRADEGKTWAGGDELPGLMRWQIWLLCFLLPSEEDLARFPWWNIGGVFKEVKRHREREIERQEVILSEEEERWEERENLWINSNKRNQDIICIMIVVRLKTL